MNEPLQGSFEGIGVQFNMVQDTLLVIQPIVNGPSERVGILAGDLKRVIIFSGSKQKVKQIAGSLNRMHIPCRACGQLLHP